MKFSTILAGALIAFGVNAEKEVKSKTTVTVFQTFTKYQPTKVYVTQTETQTKHVVTQVTQTATITKYSTKTAQQCSTTTTVTASVGYKSNKHARAAAPQPLYAMEFN